MTTDEAWNSILENLNQALENGALAHTIDLLYSLEELVPEMSSATERRLAKNQILAMKEQVADHLSAQLEVQEMSPAVGSMLLEQIHALYRESRDDPVIYFSMIFASYNFCRVLQKIPHPWLMLKVLCDVVELVEEEQLGDAGQQEVRAIAELWYSACLAAKEQGSYGHHK
jgi:hypothetical protein